MKVIKDWYPSLTPCKPFRRFFIINKGRYIRIGRWPISFKSKKDALTWIKKNDR